MTDIRRMTYDDLAREAKRRGLILRRPDVPIGWRESDAITFLCMAARCCQAGLSWSAFTRANLAFAAAPADTWLSRFAKECANGAEEWAMIAYEENRP